MLTPESPLRALGGRGGFNITTVRCPPLPHTCPAAPGFPRHGTAPERKKRSADPNVPDQQPEPETETVKFTLKIPYLGKNSESLAKVLKRKLAWNLQKKVSIRVYDEQAV